jgi:hypothetical protein
LKRASTRGPSVYQLARCRWRLFVVVKAARNRYAGYAVSQKKRKRIEECFGRLKDIALLRKLKHRGLFKVAWIFTFAAAAYNPVRMRKLIPIPAVA